MKDLIRGQKQDGDQELLTAPTTAVATPNFPAFDSTALRNCGQIIGPGFAHLQTRILFQIRKQQRFI